MKIKYYVITKINGENNFTCLGYKKGRNWVVNNGYDFDFNSIPKKDWMPLNKVRQNVFYVGELLVIDDEIGREGDWGRAPNKWNVECRKFDDPVKAMRFSNRLIKKIIDGEISH